MAMGKGEFLMWTYNKTLQYPINIKCTDPKLAKVIISDDQSMLSKTVSSLVMKIILGIFIFFLPTLISTIIGYIDDADNVTSEYRACTECLLESNCSGSSRKSTAKKKSGSKKNTTTTIDVN